jgi:hypothetical protein
MATIKYDKNWKEIVTFYSKPFIEFFFPTISKDIDWNFTPEFLEEELHNAKDLPKTKRVLDKLIKVKLKNGEEKWLFIHIEFQTTSGKVICFRMYEYYQIIRERYSKDIVALVIFTGKSAPKINNTYVHKNYDTSITYVFSSYVIAQQTEEALIANTNPFALIVLANWYSINSKDNDEKRYSFKEKLYQLGRNRGISIDEITKLHIFVTEIMKLPKHLENKFQKEVINIQTKKSNNMTYVSADTREVFSDLTKEIYGQSPEEMLAKLKIATKAAEKATAKYQKAAAIAAKEAAKEAAKVAANSAANAEKERRRSIILLHTKFGISAKEIAEKFGYSLPYVKQVITKNKNAEK